MRDGGWRGTVILTHGASRAPARWTTACVYAEAGVASPKVARFAAEHNLGGAEFLAGIPGTVGGALAMNAGCYGGETWDIVERVATIDRRGKLHARARGRVRDRLPPLRAEAARSEEMVRRPPGSGSSPGDGDDLARHHEGAARAARRHAAAVSCRTPAACSATRRGDHAARLIESCGLKGFARGGARVSEKHANFIVNPDGAAAPPTSSG